MMKPASFLESLKGALSEGTKILTDQNDQGFKTSLERWSNLDLQVPAAIVKPISEADTVTIVRPQVDLIALLSSLNNSLLRLMFHVLCV